MAAESLSWAPNTEAGRARLQKWANSFLDEKFDNEFIAQQRHATSVPWSDVDDFLQPMRIADAVAREDIETLVNLTASPDDRHYAFARLLRGKGRPSAGWLYHNGRWQHASELTAVLRNADQQVDWLLEACKATFRKQRGVLPWAQEIVAGRFSVTPAALRQFRKNRSRSCLAN